MIATWYLHTGPKKAPPSHWKVELFQKQIQTDVGHCNLFQWLNEILTPLRLTPITLGLSVRDQIGSCFKSTPLVLSVQLALQYSKTHQKSPMDEILQIAGNILKKFEKVNTEIAKYLIRRKIT